MADSIPSSDSVGYALVGFGRFCRRRLMPAFTELSSSRVVALLKRDQTEAEREAAQYNIPVAYSKLEDLLRDSSVEAVYITSANCAHEEQAIAAAQAGKHVLCEKPLATSAAACRRVIAACQEANVKLMIAQPLRFSGAVLVLKEMLDSGKLGEISSARAVFTYDAAQSPRSWIWDRQVAGGGALLDIGIHCLDTLRFLCGEVVNVKAFLRENPFHAGMERSVIASMVFGRGVLGEIFCSYEVPYSSLLEVFSSLGRVRIPSFTLPWQELNLEITTEQGTSIQPIYTGNIYGELIASFSHAIRDQGEVSIPGGEGLINLEIIESIYTSARKELS